jgi:hypothetical protein
VGLELYLDVHVYTAASYTSKHSIHQSILYIEALMGRHYVTTYCTPASVHNQWIDAIYAAIRRAPDCLTAASTWYICSRVNTQIHLLHDSSLARKPAVCEDLVTSCRPCIVPDTHSSGIDRPACLCWLLLVFAQLSLSTNWLEKLVNPIYFSSSLTGNVLPAQRADCLLTPLPRHRM